MDKETSNNSLEEYYTSQHRRLARFASIANISAWIVFTFYIILTGISILEQTGFIDHYFQQYPQSGNVIVLGTNKLNNNPVLTFRLIMVSFGTFIRGVIYGLVLKGISLGLNMIIETDINYRIQ